jgi:hypothetical protein
VNNVFEAHVFKRRNRGDREEIRLKLFNLDGSPFGGSGGSQPVYARGEFTFDSIPGNNASLDFSTADEGSFFEGCEVEGEKLWAPPGVYLMQVAYALNSSDPQPTFIVASLDTHYDEGVGWSPEPLQAWSGEGADLEYTAFLQIDGWGFANLPFYFQVVTQHDSPDLSGSVMFQIARATG